MGKKRSWFTYVKKLFNPNSKPIFHEKSRNWRWLVKRLKYRNHPAILQPLPERTLNAAAEEHKKYAVAVAIATAAAAEAAVAAANAAVEVVRLTNYNPYEDERGTLHSAAVIIQTAYRGHLARKALSALKGIVKLQAVVRGELVRREVIKKLAAITFFSKPQPLLLHRTRVPPLLDYLSHGEKRHSFVLNEGLESEGCFKLHSNTHMSLDLSLVSKEASTIRECMKQYSFSHRERRNDQRLQESPTLKSNKRNIHFDQHAELDDRIHEETEKLKYMIRSNSIAIDTTRITQLELKTTGKQETGEDLNSPYLIPRRSFSHVKKKSIGDHESLPNTPSFPAYMAATESTKAKSRSFSTPRQRFRLCESYSGPHSPYKLGLSSCSSFNGELTSYLKRKSNFQ